MDSDAGRVQWEVLRRLEDSDVTDVSMLVEQVTETDGLRPLSEHVMLHLRYGGDVDVRHVLGRAGPSLVAYGHLDVTDQVAGPSAELAVAPAYRRHGVGRQLVQHLLGESPDGRLRLWAHGEQGGAAPLATSLGFRRSRTLYQMRRSLYAALPEPVWPDGVHLRSFLPGLDDAEWLALNAAAFVDLHDQGGWTLHDLHVRMREPWFDPAGFLLAQRDGVLLGSVWTKVHPADGTQPAAGEIYVISVDPDAQGLGLGGALLHEGLDHLARRGLTRAILYCDADNEIAIRAYTRVGFVRAGVDVQFG